MSLRGLTALTTLLVHLASGVAGGFLYLCQMDGWVRSACCCSGEEDAGQMPGPALSTPDCCEVIAIAPGDSDALSERRTVLAAPALALVRLAADPSPVPVDVARARRAQTTPRPPPGPPLYLRVCTLLV